MKYRHIRQLAGQHNLSMMCRALKVTPQGYRQWFQRCPNRDKRLQEKQKLVGAITEAYKDSHHTYGRVRVRRELRDQGINVGIKRVGDLMRQEGLRDA